MAIWQQVKQQELYFESVTQMSPATSSEMAVASYLTEHPAGKDRLMEMICERGNMRKALGKVRANKGAPGVDGVTVNELQGYLRRHWPKIRQALLEGTYEPFPVRRKEIPKDTGGIRLLGIPTVLDRLIQQAVGQILQRIWDPVFSESSYGFRPGRNQHQAIRCAREFVADGYRYVVDLDLSRFFDRVHHDRLMSRLVTRVHDKRVLKLIRKFLTAGVMIGGLEEPTHEGTPQGGPLSPLMSNIVLDELDKELEKRGLRFVRYADDCVIYVKSKQAANRVIKSVSRFIETRMRLKVNRDKSAVGRPWDRKYLGFCMTNSCRRPKIRIHWKTIKQFRKRIKEITARNRGHSISQVVKELMQYMNGWWGYYGITESFNRLRPLAHWIRRRLRSLIWKQWQNRRTRVANLLKSGVSRIPALTTGCSRKGPWRVSKVKWVHFALPDKYFVTLGLSFPWV